eukprot:TRINITY_DN8438_c0_g1_i3.p1 TRINITY_DN8438_c0_g1~~TRINITY_DN8438_c0_g1_i3.p1  ORF type:complete len:556 (-),score=66.24 TRINITY_DN8438_c0_g1_i3:209-1876(-)
MSALESESESQSQESVDLEKNDEDNNNRDINGNAITESDEESKAPINAASDPASLKNLWFLFHYVVKGFLIGGFGSALLGLFYSYLHVPNYLLVAYGSVVKVCAVPYFILGLLSDTRPIFGFRRGPYIFIGWLIAAAALIGLGALKMPLPYHCIDKRGAFIVKGAPCNPSAPTEAVRYVIGIAVIFLGLVTADAAAQGLLIEYTKRETEARRGTMIATTQMAQHIGAGTGTLLMGICFNNKLYNGTFDWGLSFSGVALVCSIPVIILCIGLAMQGVQESQIKAEDRPSFRKYMQSAWHMLKRKDCFCFLLAEAAIVISSSIQTTAGTSVSVEWSGQRQLQRVVFQTAGNIFLFAGVWYVREGKKMLNCNWRKLLGGSMATITVIDAFQVFLTIYDVWRNQYFFLGEHLLRAFPQAVKAVVEAFIIAEMAEPGSEGLFTGIVATISILGQLIAALVGYLIWAAFKPDLSNQLNYEEDSQQFRNTVALSYLVGYALTFMGLFSLFLIPNQKEEADYRKTNWSRHSIFAYITVGFLGLGLVYGLFSLVLSVIPATART